MYRYASIISVTLCGIYAVVFSFFLLQINALTDDMLAKWVSIGPVNNLVPVRYQAISWTNADSLTIRNKDKRNSRQNFSFK